MTSYSISCANFNSVNYFFSDVLPFKKHLRNNVNKKKMLHYDIVVCTGSASTDRQTALPFSTSVPISYASTKFTN